MRRRVRALLAMSLFVSVLVPISPVAADDHDTCTSDLGIAPGASSRSLDFFGEFSCGWMADPPHQVISETTLYQHQSATARTPGVGLVVAQGNYDDCRFGCSYSIS